MEQPEKIVKIPDIDEHYLLFTHKSGLRVLLSEKDFYGSYGLLTFDFGSAAEECQIGEKPFSVPDGTAHFLEHKMFENPDGTDTFAYFSAIGAEANAYTGVDRTSYLFETPENTDKALNVLLRSAFTPFFTDKNVKKEKGIILQELKMYRDNPSEEIGRSLLRCMYKQRAFSKDICGSVKSVKSVTKDDLYRAYGAFYTPQNAVLALCGKFDAARVKALLDEILPASCAQTPAVSVPRETTNEVRRRKAVLYSDVRTPYIAIGLKFPPAENGKEKLKTFDLMSILAFGLFSTSSKYVSDMKKANLLPADSSYEVVHNERQSNILFFAQTYDPDRALKLFDRHFKRILEKGLARADFERGKKMLYSDFLESFNSSEGVTTLLSGDLLDGIDTSHTPRTIFELKKEEADEFIKRELSARAISRVITLPKECKKGKATK